MIDIGNTSIQMFIVKCNRVVFYSALDIGTNVLLLERVVS